MNLKPSSPTGSFIKPSFFIIGERKCGTSSLYRYLIAHPYVLPGRLKEIQFFSKHSPGYIQDHIGEYWSQFPSQSYQGDLQFEWPELDRKGILYHEQVQVRRIPDRTYLTGEASANTFCEVAPELLHRYLPNIKLILLFRDPVSRAFSHHRMYQRFQEEGRKLEVKVSTFAEDMEREIQAYSQGNPSYFLQPGIYIQQLKKWQDVFPLSHFKIYLTEELQHPNSAQEIMKDLQSFLDLPYFPYDQSLGQHFNKAPSKPIDPQIKKVLQEFYRPHNEALALHLGQKLPW